MVKEGSKSRCHFAAALFRAGIYTEAKVYKELSDHKKSLFITGVRSYRCCKPIARAILTDNIHM